MKRLLFASTVTAILLLSGCSDTEPVVEEAPQTTEAPAEEINIVDENSAADDQPEITSTTNLDDGMISAETLESRMSPIYFAFDKYNVSEDDVEVVNANVNIINKNSNNNFSIKLEGNCDEWGSDEYNFALGLKRAHTIKNELINDGVAASSITLVSYGSSSPVCTDKTQECWSKNRRVDFRILP